MATAAETKPIIRLDFEGNPILVQMGDHGSVWYAAKPLCTAIGFTKMTAALERHVKPCDQQPRGVPTGGGVQQMLHVNEAGMRALVSASHLVAARRFRKWIAAGVIHAAVRAMEAQDGEVLGDRLQGMTEFKPIEQRSELIAGERGNAVLALPPMNLPRPAGIPEQGTAATEAQPEAHQQEKAMNAEVTEFKLEFDGIAMSALVGKDGVPLFRLNQICGVLGFSNPYQAVKTHVQDDDLQKLEVIDSMGRGQLTSFVNESGLYALIFGSNKESAKKFKKWVTSEVLPSIRKTGRYSAEKAASPSPGPIQAPGNQEKLQGAMDVARALIGVGEATLGREGLKAQVPHLSHPEVALGLAGLILKNKRFLLTLDDIEHPVIRPLEKNEMIIKASGHEWIDKLLSVMNQDQLKAMARLAMARIV